MRHFVRRHWKLLIVLAVVLYIVIGMLAPFAVQKRIAPGENPLRTQDFYAGAGEGMSVDRAHVVEENREALELRLRMAQEAQERIILSTFDFREDESTWDLAAALYEAAQRGVKVEIMVDGISGLLRMERNPFFYALSSHPDIEIRIYNPPNLLLPWTINGRMHDKYVICDDKALLLGGRNTFRYFLGDYATDDRSYDREVMIYNTDFKNGTDKSVISQVEKYFREIWDGPHMKVFHDDESLSGKSKVKACIDKMKSRYEGLKEQYPESYGEYSYEENTVAVKKTALISGETGIYGKKPLVWDTLKKLMAGAENKVVFHTPYAVLDSQMEEGMREIAGNVDDFTMILNSVENGDNVVASSDYRIHKKDIIETGVQIYEFDGGDSTHGKSILIDDDLAIIGSYNLDMRSTYMDTELMLAVQGEEFSKELKEHMDVFQEKCRKVLDEKNYEVPEGVTVQKLPLKKKIIFSILGPLLQPFRYVA
ncbi:MAG: phospholipase D family protein [Eubacteriales bacterium]|nr:phospholipase D family protein [Eubacteriales bacterium]